MADESQPLEHTPTPWTAWGVVGKDHMLGIYDERGDELIATLPVCVQGHADRRRILAAVNAVAGIDTAALESLQPGELAGAIRKWLQKEAAAHCPNCNEVLDETDGMLCSPCDREYRLQLDHEPENRVPDANVPY